MGRVRQVLCPVLVGREEEVQVLLDGLDRAADGRDAAGGEDGAGRDLVATLVARRAARAVELGRLDDEATIRLARACLSTPASPAAVEAGGAAVADGGLPGDGRGRPGHRRGDAAAGRRLVPDDPARTVPIDDALTDVLAQAGQVDRAFELGERLLARLDLASRLPAGGGRAASAAGPGRRGGRPLAGGRRASGRRPGRSRRRTVPRPGRPLLDALDAQVALGQGRLGEAGPAGRGGAGGGASGTGCPPSPVRRWRWPVGSPASGTWRRPRRRSPAGWPSPPPTAWSCGGCGRCTSSARSISCAPRASNGCGRPASWRSRSAPWPWSPPWTCRSPPG